MFLKHQMIPLNLAISITSFIYILDIPAPSINQNIWKLKTFSKTGNIAE